MIHVCFRILRLPWQTQDLTLAWKLCSRAANCRCVQREGLLASGNRTWGLLHWKPDLFWKALVQGRAFCGEKVVRDAGGSYETYEQKEKSYPRFCRGGYWGDVIWLELHGKLIKGPRLVPNELPGALSFDGPNHVCCESRCKLLSEVWAKDVDIGWQRRSNLGKAINQTTVFECAHHESVLWWGGSSCFSPP